MTITDNMTYAQIDSIARKELVPGVAYAIQESINTGITPQVAVTHDGVGVIWFDSISHMFYEIGIDHVITMDSLEDFEALRDQ